MGEGYSQVEGEQLVGWQTRQWFCIQYFMGRGAHTLIVSYGTIFH